MGCGGVSPATPLFMPPHLFMENNVFQTIFLWRFPTPFLRGGASKPLFMGAQPPNPLRAVISHVSESLCSNKEFLTHSQIKAAISGFAVLNRAHIMEID